MITKLMIEALSSSYFHHGKVPRKRFFLKSGDKDISSSSWQKPFSLKTIVFSSSHSFPIDKKKVLSERYIL
jgi:hypothetical protein